MINAVSSFAFSADGKVILQTNVPDTITSWVASAFAISDVTGLGVASSTARVRPYTSRSDEIMVYFSAVQPTGSMHPALILSGPP